MLEWLRALVASLSNTVRCAFVSLPFHTRSVSAVNCQFLNLLCVCVVTCVSWHTCGGQRRSWFSPSTIWELGGNLGP